MINYNIVRIMYLIYVLDFCTWFMYLIFGLHKEDSFMEEKIYKLMRGTGATTLAVGISILVTGVTAGILLIISGAKLLKHKDKAFH